MLTITKLFEKAFEVKQKRNWEKIYIAVDIHETIVKPTWEVEISKVYYPYAKECLQLLTQMKDVVLIQWSSSLAKVHIQYTEFFNENGIVFDYINCNGDVPSPDYADFESKFYMNVILDDKAGFEPCEWEELYQYLLTLNKIDNEN